MRVTDILEKAGGKPARKRRGRGPGSGLGKTSGRGHKGARSRSGWKERRYYEGGQMPLIRRMPKRGFTNARFRKRFDLISIARISELFEAGDRVDLQALISRGFLKPRYGRLKVLGQGEIDKSLTVVADRFTQSARKKVEKAGGKIEAPAGTPGK